jgi:hypothetical protein
MDTWVYYGYECTVQKHDYEFIRSSLVGGDGGSDSYDQ